MRQGAAKRSLLKNKNSAFITLFSSYLLIFLLPVTIGVVMYGKIERNMTDQGNRSNLVMMEQLMLVADNRLKELEYMAEQITLNARLQFLLSKGASESPADQYKFVEFMQDLTKFGNADSMILDYYVYVKEGDQIVTANMKTSPETFYRLSLGYEDMTASEWRQRLFETNHYKSYLPAERVSHAGMTRNAITFVQSLPIDTMSGNKGTLVILVDEQQFKQLLAKIEWGSKGSVFIVNDDNEVLMNTGEVTDSIRAIIPTLIERSGMTEVKSEGRAQMVSYTSSDRNGWKYMTVVPKSAFLEVVDELKMRALFLLAFCLIGGAVISYLLAYRHYSPVKELVSLIRNKKSITETDSWNEFDFIKETMQTAFNDEKKLRAALTQQTAVVQANFLGRLIRGQVDSSSLTESSLADMGIRFASNRFRVLLVEINDCSRFVQGEHEKEWALARFVIGNIAGELLDSRGYVLELDQRRLAVVMNEEGQAEHGSETAGSFAEELCQTAETSFRMFITIAVSGVREGADSLGHCFREAGKALDYKLIARQNRILFYESLQTKLSAYYYYPVEMEVQLMNFTKSGEHEQIAKTLAQLYETNLQADSITLEMGRCLYYEIIGTLLKTLHSLNIEYSSVFGDGINPILRLGDCKTFQEMHMLALDWYIEVCDYLAAGRTDHRDRLLSAITKHIDEHYDDVMLSLTTISEKLDITPQYLSTFFKRQSGQNITDYIAHVRVQEAKRLMAESPLALAQIAGMAGFGNNISFNRVFKKIEGITPGKYREQLRQPNSINED